MNREKLIKKAKKFYHKDRVPISFEMLVVTLDAKDLFGIMADFALSIQPPKVTDEEIKKIACDFFRHFWNTGGTNADQAYDEWIKTYTPTGEKEDK